MPYRQYTQELWRKFGYLAAWLPNVHLALGDIGVVRDGIFEPVTSLKQLGIAFAVEPGGSGVELSYASNDKVMTTTKAGAKTGPAAVAKGKVAVEFRAENAVLFQASGGVVSRIADLKSLGELIIKRHEQDRWERRHVVLTDLVTVAAATILISNGDHASIELDVEGDLTPTIGSLAKANVKLGVRHEAGIGTRIVGETGLTPLFKVAGIRGHLFGPDEFARRGSGEKSDTLRFADISYDELTSPDWDSRSADRAS
jgi:hypothetical protein